MKPTLFSVAANAFRSIVFAFCLAFLFAPIALVGCKSSPNAIAYKTSSGVVATVDSAMQAFAQYAHQETLRIAALPVIDQGSQSASLLKTEGKVREAYGRYQQAIAAANIGVTTADSTTVAPEVSGAAAALLSVIQSVVKP